MRRIVLSASIAAACLLTAAHAAPPAASSSNHTYSPAITAADFAASDKAISSDAMQGRKPGTPGAKRATAWIVDQFKRIGLVPANNGKWFQAVPTVSTTLTNTDVALKVDEGGRTQSFAYNKDMIVGTLQAKPHVSLKDSDIVFVGYGVDAPEYNWNDYANQDVKGKTVILLVNDPGFGDHDASLFKGRTMTYYGRWTYKYEEAARQGAAACFVVHDSEAAGYPWSVVVNSWSGPQLALTPSDDPAPHLPVAGWLTTDAARQLFAKAGLDFDKLKAAADHRGFKPVALKAKASITLDNTIVRGTADNVLGMVRGSKRPDEALVYSAHWDHLGMDPKLKGDQIYNGAVDNGSGIAALIELADKFAHDKPAPQRSVLFAAWTLEESGLLGSRYYVAHPVIPLDKTVAEINMDALVPIGKTRNITVVGAGQSQLEDLLKDALSKQGRHTSPEPTPENGFYFRSDHFNFAKAGVPALDTLTGDDLVNGGTAAGDAALADYTKNRYHTVHDNFDPSWDFSGSIEDVQALYMLGDKLANSDQWPKWYQGSEFRAAREKMMSH